MNDKFYKKFRQKVYCLLFGYLPLALISYLIFSRRILAFPVVAQVILAILAIASMIIVISYRKKAKSEVSYSSKMVQFIFIFITGGMGTLGIFRGLFALEFYQRFIGYLSAIICFIIMFLLILGLKYYNDKK
ncbi:TPA: hypothetical protein ACGOVM_000401 [Streptococcus suis]